MATHSTYNCSHNSFTIQGRDYIFFPQWWKRVWSFAPWHSGVSILPHFQEIILMWKQFIFCIPSALPSSVLGINTTFFPTQQLKGHGKPEFEGAQSFLMNCASKSVERLHWNTGWLSWTELRMLKYRNNRAISHEVWQHSRQRDYLVHHRMWQVYLVALLSLN